MKYYLLDDDINIIKILERIIESNFNRSIVGFNSNPEKAVEDILLKQPDAVLIDYLIPVMDGVDVIKKVKKFIPHMPFIMISQVEDKEMIAEAYSEGLKFFISKPINKIEVDAVLKNLEEQLETAKKFEQIVSLIGQPNTLHQDKETPMESAKKILKDLGVLSEKGSKDILAIIEIMAIKQLAYDSAFEDHYKKQNETTKIIRQRIRRSIIKALRNIAYLGLEDYLNETFVKYSSTLFDFETVKLEMDNIRGISSNKGSVSINKFIDNLYAF